MTRRQFSMEQLERRIVLSVSPSTVAASAFFGSSHSNNRSFQTSDNTTHTARDLGSLDQPIVISDQAVGTFDERDVFRFEMSTSGTASIVLTGLSADADLYLLNASRQTVAASTSGGSQVDSIEQDLEAGEYFVVVQNYNRWRSTGYSLHLSAELDVQSDPVGNTFGTALDFGSLRGTRTYSDFVGSNDGLDVFQFDVEASTRFEANLTGLTGDLDLYLFAESGQELVKSDRSGSASEGIVGWIAPGSYYVVVDAYASASSDYTLALESNLPNATPPINTPPASETPPTDPPPTTTPPPIATPPVAPPATPVLDTPLASVPYFGSSTRDWGLNAVNAPESWAAGYTGEGITVAVIDTGVQLNHADLAHSIWVNADEIPGDGIDNDRNGFVDDVNGWDFIDRDNSPSDGNGHGTHVAGIIAAANNSVGGTGVAYASSILPIRVLDDNGSGSTNGVAQGIRYAVDNGAQVINLSLGGGDSQSVYSALRYAEQNNVLVVAASGNESAGVPGHPASHSATLSNVLSVGAYSSAGRIASFSNDVGGSGAVQIDAPGQSIFSTYIGNRYTSLSGTSMAAPFVSGVAALAWAADPTLAASAVRDALTESVGASVSGSDSLGRLDAAAVIPLALSGSVTTTNASAASSIATTNTTRSAALQRVWATIAFSDSLPLSVITPNETPESEELAPLEVADVEQIAGNLVEIAGNLVEISDDVSFAESSQQTVELAGNINNPGSIDDAFANVEFDAFKIKAAAV